VNKAFRARVVVDIVAGSVLEITTMPLVMESVRMPDVVFVTHD
jgi:hypothetical protein